jgi:hypothetical protein
VPPQTRVPRLLSEGFNGTSLRSCSDLQFTSWEDPLVFALCDLGFCDEMDDAHYLGIARFDFAQKRGACQSPDADAYRLCATVSAAKAVPAIIVLSTALALASSAILAILTLIAPSMSLAWQVSVYNHAEAGEDIN